MDQYPVVVVGAGPIGLAAAAHALEYELTPIVLEAGAEVGSSVRQWGHIRMFSMWRDLVDPACRKVLATHDWVEPETEQYPTGEQWVRQYLDPLGAALSEHVRLGTRVVGVARRGRDRMVDAGRDTEPFSVHVVDTHGHEEIITAAAVIDASGTWDNPNPLGGDGISAPGETSPAVRSRLAYRPPDLRAPEVQDRYAGRRIAVVGSGHSALTVLVQLAELAKKEPGTRIRWILRRPGVGNVFGGGENDQLPARGALGERAYAAVQAGQIEVITGFRAQQVTASGDELLFTGTDGHELEPVDEAIVLTGFRPELSWLSEIRLSLDTSLQAPVGLAPLIDPNVHSCGTVYPHGVAELAHFDKNFFQVGMKSYGRAPTFLALTGFEQVRSVVAEIAGDHESAAQVQLRLPETGVCGGAGIFDEPEADGGCCTSSQPELLDLTTKPAS